ncbi:hypothetical protein GZH49_12170 [Nocardia terpenica]|uniref:hypothetical protein n=1 Tax=Nocardia terpenica TaxID=455432 RepID=UPI002FE39C09
MITTPEDVAAEVERRYPSQVAAQRAADRSVVRYGGWSNVEEQQWPRAVREVAGPAVTVPDIQVCPEVGYLSWAGDLGSFAEGIDVTGVLVTVRGLGVAESDDPGARVALPVTESEGWARALLGPDWAKQAYFFRCEGGDFDHVHYILVLVDRDGQAVTAPADFFFPAIPERWGIATVSDRTGRVIVRRLQRGEDGQPEPEALASATPPESLRWQVDLTGSGPEEIRAAARALLDTLRPKGAIHHDFRLLSLRLDGQNAVIGFERRSTGTYSEQRVALPTDFDLSEPTDFFRHTMPRLPYPPRTAAEWAGEICLIFREWFGTGVMGLQYDNPGLV